MFDSVLTVSCALADDRSRADHPGHSYCIGSLDPSSSLGHRHCCVWLITVLGGQQHVGGQPLFEVDGTPCVLSPLLFWE